MALGKQAKTLSKGQTEAVLAYLVKTRWPARNRLIFLLSAKAGLRAKEIAHLTWWMTNDSQGEVGWSMCLLNSASKGKSGRMIPLSEDVRKALIEYRNEVKSIAGKYVISTERSLQTSPQAIVNMFQRWYRHLGFVGCSSHSGRRTFITNAARKISTVGGSLRDVQVLAGHTNLRTTQGYIDANPEAQVRGGQNELILGTSWATQSKSTELQDALQVCEPHLDLLALTSRLLKIFGARERPGDVSGMLMDVARDLA